MREGRPPRHEEARPRRSEAPSRHEARHEERPRYEDRPRREGRDRDDLGPPVRGFGDSIPAFMLIPIPRPRRTAEDAEAA